MTELMVSLVMGLIILAAVGSVFVSSRVTSEVVSAKTDVLEDARVSLHLLGQDILMSGSWGRLTHAGFVDGRRGDGGELASIAGDCAPGWYIDLNHKLFATNGSNPYATTCLGASADYRDGTDVLVVRYASIATVADGLLSAGTTYLRGSAVRGELFVGGGAVPDVFSATNHPLQAFAYYVSNYTEFPGDGIPALRRIRLAAGPDLIDELIAPGIEDFQVQLGVDRCDPKCDDAIDYYLDPDSPEIDWGDPIAVNRILTVQVWLLVRGEQRTPHLNTSATYELGSRVVTTPNDGYRRQLLSSVFKVRNRSSI